MPAQLASRITSWASLTLVKTSTSSIAVVVDEDLSGEGDGLIQAQHVHQFALARIPADSSSD
jgi:hypothetical protein